MAFERVTRMHRRVNGKRDYLGVSLGDAALLDWDKASVYPDLRRDYGEARMITLVPLDKCVHSVVFVDRAGKRRVISLRKAHFKEVKRYEASRT